MIRIGCSTSRNCGTPKSNSPWKVESATRKPPTISARRNWKKPVPAPSGSWPAALTPSAISTIAPSVASEPPPISIRWVGPQSVTSWPKRRCQKSSSGKPESAKAPQAVITMPPIGAYQPGPMRTAEAQSPSLQSAIESTPASSAP